MGCISLYLESVRLAEDKALEGLKAILRQRGGDVYGVRFFEKLEKSIAKVDAGGDPVKILCQHLDEEGFHVKRKDGFIHLPNWAEDGYGKSFQEVVILKALGDLFEAGGESWCFNEEDRCSWQYRFLGGSYEMGFAPEDCFVSREDQDRVALAFQEAEGLLTGNALQVLRDALLRSRFLLSQGAVSC